MNAYKLIVASVVVCFSCQPKQKEATTTANTSLATEKPDSAVDLTKRPGPDAPRSAADRLVRALYFEHNVKENPFREKKDRALIDQYFDKPTADLIWSDSQKASGKINRAKINLLFNAPDAAVKKTWVEPAAVGGTKAVVFVTYQNSGKPEEVKIDLQQLAGRWRITEMYYPGGKQLTQLLK